VSVAGRFAANLLRERKRADLSQDAVSLRADLHRTEISQLERGLRLARIDTLVKLAGALEIEPGELLAGIRWKPPTVDVGEFTDADASL
jgi:transcriptional regulator with XRE-family HTH domain